MYAAQIYHNAFGCFRKGQTLLNMDVFPIRREIRASSKTSFYQDQKPFNHGQKPLRLMKRH